MTKCAFIPNFLKFYNILWLAALPFLRRNRRLSASFERRTSPQLSPADIWLQAASAGEAFLALSILARMTPPDTTRVLVTTTTDQGMEVLDKGLKTLQLSPRISAAVDYFPFDTRAAVKKAADQVRPKVMVLLETELWPAFLHELKHRRIPIILVNGRMSEKSGYNYKKTRGLWQCLAPNRILAISQEDCTRYRKVFEHTPTKVMHNIKFDILDLPEKATVANEPSLSHLFPGDTPLSVIASFRRQEEEEIITLIVGLRSSNPGHITLLFPRHMHRIPNMKKKLRRHGIPFTLRSELSGPVSSPRVILWDRFGELRKAYALAATVFVGGSLKPLGGQNFIEPAVLGIPTVTGPFRKDFAWTGEELFSLGIVTGVRDARDAARVMAGHLQTPPDREQNKKKARDYIASRTGGSDMACRAIFQYF